MRCGERWSLSRRYRQSSESFVTALCPLWSSGSAPKPDRVQRQHPGVRCARTPGRWPLTPGIFPIVRDYLQLPLGLQSPEQQSSSASQGSFLPAQPASQTSPGSQLGEPSGLLQLQVPSAQQLWPSKHIGFPPTPGSSSGLQHALAGGLPTTSLGASSAQHPTTMAASATNGTILLAAFRITSSTALQPIRNERRVSRRDPPRGP